MQFVALRRLVYTLDTATHHYHHCSPTKPYTHPGGNRRSVSALEEGVVMDHQSYPNQTIQLLCERAGCRSWTDQLIPAKVLHTILEAGTHAATSSSCLATATAPAFIWR
jgi:hypothetical protein